MKCDGCFGRNTYEWLFVQEKEQQMKISQNVKRALVALAASGAVGGALLGASITSASATTGAPAITSASASTIPYQHVQICAQGNYTVQAYFSTGLGNFLTTLIPAKTCWYHDVPGVGGTGWQPIKVYGFWNTHPNESFYIGTEYYNLDSSGIGIGAEGVTTHPYLWNW
jgi:hypothetical protein